MGISMIGSGEGDVARPLRFVASSLLAILGRAVPAAFFGGLALARLAHLQRTADQGAWGADGAGMVAHSAAVAHEALGALFVGGLAVLCLARRHSLRKLSRPAPQVMAVLGTWIIVILPLQPVTQTHWLVDLVASLLLASGMACALVSLLTLGRCFGILPEARGLVTSGPYRLVRHPLYTSEALASLGLLLPVASAFTVTVYVLFLGLQAMRTRYEEEVLEGAFPEYADYRRTTWRFIPGVF